MKNSKRHEERRTKKERQQFEAAFKDIDRVAAIGVGVAAVAVAGAFYLFNQPAALGGIISFVSSGATFVVIRTYCANAKITDVLRMPDEFRKREAEEIALAKAREDAERVVKTCGVVVTIDGKATRGEPNPSVNSRGKSARLSSSANISHK